MTPTTMVLILYGALLVALSGGIVSYRPRPTGYDFWQMLAFLVLVSGLLLTGVWLFLQVATAILAQLG